MGPDNMHCRVLKKLAGVGVEPLYPIGKLMACEIPSDQRKENITPSPKTQGITDQ